MKVYMWLYDKMGWSFLRQSSSKKVGIICELYADSASEKWNFVQAGGFVFIQERSGNGIKKMFSIIFHSRFFILYFCTRRAIALFFYRYATLPLHCIFICSVPIMQRMPQRDPLQTTWILWYCYVLALRKLIIWYVTCFTYNHCIA